MNNNHDSKQSTSEKNIQVPAVIANKQKTKKKGNFRNTLLSGIIGGVISAVLMFFLFTNYISPNQHDNNNSSVAAKNVETPISDIITEDDYAPPSINELSKAIVGIINLKQQNIWTPNKENASGSGIIFEKEDGKAYIVTNNHVVEGATGVEVELNNKEKVEATVLGTDALTDLAILEMDSTHVEYVATLGSSDDLQIGDTVLAIGNPLSLDFSGSVTKGIISGLDRALKVDTNGDGHPDWITEVIQTDAAINPGNSGGALVNSEGKVVGINSMKIAQQSVEGIGFAIPISTALPIMEQLKTDGEVARPFIGITPAELSQVPIQYHNKVILPEDFEDGIVIANVQQDSPANEVGLQQFDVITKINDHEITSLLDLRKYMYSETSIGDTIEIEVIRDGKIKTFNLKLIEQTI